MVVKTWNSNSNSKLEDYPSLICCILNNSTTDKITIFKAYELFLSSYQFGYTIIRLGGHLLTDFCTLNVILTLPGTLMTNLFSSRAPHIHILPHFCNDSACRLVCQRHRYSVVWRCRPFTFPFSGEEEAIRQITLNTVSQFVKVKGVNK